MYDRLIVGGDSIAFGAEMPDVKFNFNFPGPPSKFAWPQLLGDYLDITTVDNISLSGASNGFIVRSLIERIEQLPNDEKTLVGIMFSGKKRFEYIGDCPEKEKGLIWKRAGTWNMDPKYFVDHLIVKKENWIRKYYSDGQNDIQDTYNTLRDMYYIQLYLQNKNIDYFMSYAFEDAIPNVSLEVFESKLEFKSMIYCNLKVFEPLIDWTKIYNEEGGFQEWAEARNYTKGKFHYFEDAHKGYVEEALGPWVKREFP